MDQNLTYELEVKHLLKKWACGIKTLYCVRELLPEKNMFITTKRSGHQSPTISSTVTERNFTKSNNHARKSISWGIKACCNRNKHESPSDLKLKHQIFPVRLLFDYRASTYFWKLQKNLVPAFNGLNKLSTAKFFAQSPPLACSFAALAPDFAPKLCTRRVSACFSACFKTF